MFGKTYFNFSNMKIKLKILIIKLFDNPLGRWLIQFTLKERKNDNCFQRYVRLLKEHWSVVNRKGLDVIMMSLTGKIKKLNLCFNPDDISYGIKSQFGVPSTSSIYVTKLDTNKFVVVFKNANSGNARVATVNETTISWGALSEFYAAPVGYISSIQLNTDKFVVVFADTAASKGKARAATVSGTTISWGAVSEFNAAIVGYPSSTKLDTNKFVVVFKDDNKGKARIATVSGTTISWGDKSEFLAGITTFNSAVLIDVNKFVVVFQDLSDFEKGKARAATVSGTTISWGSIVTFEDGRTTSFSCTAMDNTHFVVAYKEIVETKGLSCFCSVDGTTIIPGIPEEFSGYSVIYVSITFISSNKVAVVFDDENDVFKGKAVIGITEVYPSPFPAFRK